MHLAGGPGHDRLFGVVVNLRSETAADIGGHNPQPRLRDVQHKGAHQQADHVRVLARRVQRVFAGRAVELADRRAWLHRIGDEAVVGKVELDDPRRPGKGSLDGGEIAELPVVAEIARRLAVDLWRARLQRRDRFDGGRLLDIIDIHQLGRVAGLSQRFGDDHRHLVADIADPVDSQHRVRRLGHRRTVLGVDLPAARQTADTVGHHVLAGVYGDDARRPLRRRGVDRRDLRMGVRAAQDVGIELAWTIDVVGVGASPGKKSIILSPPDRRSDRRHGLTPRPPHGR